MKFLGGGFNQTLSIHAYRKKVLGEGENVRVKESFSKKFNKRLGKRVKK